ncbi:MAG: hypothetical protein FWG79_05575 [Bacteroidales bacterium]|nr:hypothetical protein [Bacteroidales bacterium]
MRQCIGSKAVFAVSGNPYSTYNYSITDLYGNPKGGQFLNTDRLDSIVVEWGLDAGLLRIGVQEITGVPPEIAALMGIPVEGCEGEWVYIMVDLGGVRFIPESTSHNLVHGESVEIKFDTRLFKRITWDDPSVVTNGTDGIYHIVNSGTHTVVVEDMYGCTHTEVFEVIPIP